MTQEEKIKDITNAILKHYSTEEAEEALDTLLTVATLMLENISDRLTGATYARSFKHGRLTVKVEMSKRNPNG